jgi:predicted RNase H-like HicB family nuclease
MNMTLNEYLRLKYLTIVIPEECTDGTFCYRAEHPQLPGCMSHGLTPDEAIRNLIEAKRLYIETLLEKGLDIPLTPQPTVGTLSSSPSTIVVQEPQQHIPSEFDMLQAVSEAA